MKRLNRGRILGEIFVTVLIILASGLLLSYALRLFISSVIAAFSGDEVTGTVYGLVKQPANIGFSKYYYVFSYRVSRGGPVKRAVNLIPQYWVNGEKIGKEEKLLTNPLKRDSVIIKGRHENILIGMYMMVFFLLGSSMLHGFFRLPMSQGVFLQIVGLVALLFFLIWTRLPALRLDDDTIILPEQFKARVPAYKKVILDHSGMSRQRNTLFLCAFIAFVTGMVMFYRLYPVITQGDIHVVSVAEVKRSKARFGEMQRPVIRFQADEGEVEHLIRFPRYFSFPYEVGDKLEARCFSRRDVLRELNLERGFMTYVDRCLILNGQLYAIFGILFLVMGFPFLRLERRIL